MSEANQVSPDRTILWALKVPIIGISAGWFAGGVWIWPDPASWMAFFCAFLTMNGMWLS